ncbi:hypothetical protein HYPSUDRAFT_275516 [Hypholoma sublateritium FD-334 SS-4]|uniref:Uncharacterized protein n=1 Tax=Hypholoma sublateritium (strain FD-334 SS-4) TaxID=945553 RepID=A0A0D2Q4F3_HYPSF|nr:hypothetical protein HYPSUDRAFT_275516 [Hypholoma sublateritium FD-334 SS-4]
MSTSYLGLSAQLQRFSTHHDDHEFCWDSALALLPLSAQAHSVIDVPLLPAESPPCCTPVAHSLGSQVLHLPCTPRPPSQARRTRMVVFGLQGPAVCGCLNADGLHRALFPGCCPHHLAQRPRHSTRRLSFPVRRQFRRPQSLQHGVTLPCVPYQRGEGAQGCNELQIACCSVCARESEHPYP